MKDPSTLVKKATAVDDCLDRARTREEVRNWVLSIRNVHGRRMDRNETEILVSMWSTTQRDTPSHANVHDDWTTQTPNQGTCLLSPKRTIRTPTQGPSFFIVVSFPLLGHFWLKVIHVNHSREGTSSMLFV